MVKYDSYKDSGVEWISEIPSQWDYSNLKYLLKRKISDGPHETPVFTDEGIPFLSVDGIQNGELVFEGCRYISQDDHDKYKQKCPVEINDILMGKAASIGKIARVKVDFPISVWSPLAIIKSNKNILNSIFLEYSLKSTFLQDQIEIYSTSNTQKNISMDDIQRLQIVFPPLNEQQQIVSFLDTKTSLIDSLIEKTQRKIKLLKEKRTSLINHTVTKGLNPNVEMKDSGVEWIGEIPEHWKRKKLGYLVNLQGRIGFKGYKKTDFVDEGEGCRVIGGKHIDKNNKINLSNPDFLHWDKYYESPEIMVFKGDLIISQRGTLGKVLLIEDDYGPLTINPSLVVVNQIKENTKFLWYSLQSDTIMKTIDIEGSVTTVPMLSQEEISSFPILVPPSQEQQQIVEYLDKQSNIIDTTVTKEEKRIELLKEYRQSLISEVVTGKVKVCD